LTQTPCVAHTFADGMMHPGEAPGLRVDIDETLAAQYPYRRAYLPINRVKRKRRGSPHAAVGAYLTNCKERDVFLLAHQPKERMPS